tara:strand:- start:453 stop:875 length:423 start_codon:yes stop_codon:yes gene_type:complete
MHFIKVTEIMKNRETRSIVLNTSNIESVADGLLARITIGLGDPRELKEMRPVRCSMVSGKTVDIKFNGTAESFVNLVYSNSIANINQSPGVHDLTWDSDDTTENFDEVIDVYDNTYAEKSDVKSQNRKRSTPDTQTWQRL